MAAECELSVDSCRAVAQWQRLQESGQLNGLWISDPYATPTVLDHEIAGEDHVIPDPRRVTIRIV